MVSGYSSNCSTHPADIDLRIAPQDVHAVPGMSDLIESIKTYINPANPANDALNVAIVFAAIVSALRASDIQTERADNRSQYFHYCFRGEGYRVSPDFQSGAVSFTQETDSSLAKHKVLLSATTSQSPVVTKHAASARASVSQRRRQGLQAKKAVRAAARDSCERHVILLQKLFKKQPTSAQASSMVMQDVSARSGSTTSDHEAWSNFAVAAIRDVFGQLLDREAEAKSATKRVYEAYAKLGCCFVELVAQTCNGIPPSPEKKEFHQAGFTIMEKAMEGWLRRAVLSRSALIKRLERARKVFLLLRCFGDQIFDDDALTMRLVDKTTFQALSILLRPTLAS